MAVAARALTLHIPPHIPGPGAHIGKAGLSTTASPQVACSATVWSLTVPCCSWPARMCGSCLFSVVACFLTVGQNCGGIPPHE